MTFWPTCEQTDPSFSGRWDLHFFRSPWAMPFSSGKCPWVFCWNLAQSLDHLLATCARAGWFTVRTSDHASFTVAWPMLTMIHSAGACQESVSEQPYKNQKAYGQLSKLLQFDQT